MRKLFWLFLDNITRDVSRRAWIRLAELMADSGPANRKKRFHACFYPKLVPGNKINFCTKRLNFLLLNPEWITYPYSLRGWSFLGGRFLKRPDDYKSNEERKWPEKVEIQRPFLRESRKKEQNRKCRAIKKSYKDEPDKCATKRRTPQHKIKTFLNGKPCKGADRALVVGGEGGGDLRAAGHCPRSLQCRPPMLQLADKFISSFKELPHKIVKG